jgi:hypothetical protein
LQQVEDGIAPYLVNYCDESDRDGGVVVRVRVHPCRHATPPPEGSPTQSTFDPRLPLYDQIIDGQVLYTGKITVHLWARFDMG